MAGPKFTRLDRNRPRRVSRAAQLRENIEEPPEFAGWSDRFVASADRNRRLAWEMLL